MFELAKENNNIIFSTFYVYKLKVEEVKYRDVSFEDELMNLLNDRWDRTDG